jgi:ATP-dependent Clp protease protease subunit
MTKELVVFPLENASSEIANGQNVQGTPSILVPSATLPLLSEKEPSEKSDKNSQPSVEKELFEGRIILISAGVDPKLAHAVNSKLLALERHDPKAPIYMFINSPGGEVHSGFSIFDCARFINPPVVTIVTGLAASMGSIISLCARPEHRFAFPNAKFLVHQPSITGMGGSVSDIEIHAKDLIDTKNRIIDLYCKECSRTPDEVKKALDRDNWMSPEGALAWGHISRVVSSREELRI